MSGRKLRVCAASSRDAEGRPGPLRRAAPCCDLGSAAPAWPGGCSWTPACPPGGSAGLELSASGSGGCCACTPGGQNIPEAGGPALGGGEEKAGLRVATNPGHYPPFFSQTQPLVAKRLHVFLVPETRRSHAIMANLLATQSPKRRALTSCQKPTS